MFIGTKQFEILATEPEIVVSDVTFPLFSRRYVKDDFEKKLSENPLNTRLIKNTAEETPEDSQIMKTEPDETENAGVPYTDAFLLIRRIRQLPGCTIIPTALPEDSM